VRATNPIDAQRNRGFTLVELIAATTLMTIVLAGVYTTFTTAIRTWRGGEINYQTYQDARLALGTLTRELRSIPEEARHLMYGSEDRLEFITLAKPLNVETASTERLLWVEYRLEEVTEASGLVLVREEALVEGPLPVNLGEQAPLEPLIVDLGRAHAFDVATGVRGLSFYYQWAIPEVVPTNQPPPDARIVGDTVVERALPEGIWITLSLDDPGRGAGEPVSTFRDLVTFRAGASAVPKYLDPRRQGEV